MSERRQCECCGPMVAFGGKKASELLGESEFPSPPRGTEEEAEGREAEEIAPATGSARTPMTDSGAISQRPTLPDAEGRGEHFASKPRCTFWQGEWSPVPLDVANCPECGAQLEAYVDGWNERRGYAIGLLCSMDVDGDDEHLCYQSDWQPVFETVEAWANSPLSPSEQNAFGQSVAHEPPIPGGKL